MPQPPRTERAAGTSTPHESARAQVAGAVTYIDDMPEVRGTLFAAPILSTVAHGHLRGVDSRAALAMPGVVDVVLAADIPGDNVLASFAGDEVIFAQDTVQHMGQVVGLVVAQTAMQARHAARRVKLAIDALPAVLTIQEALAAKNYVLPPVFVNRGDAAQALARAPHRLSGTLEVGGQEHFYLEGQIAYVLPQEQNQWSVYSSTQHPRRGAALGGACAGPGQPRRACGMPAHGRRIWRQGNAGRAPGSVGSDSSPQITATHQTAPGPRRRLHGHRQTPPLCLRIHRGL
jgi:xanthine dehydrogenase large subunit